MIESIVCSLGALSAMWSGTNSAFFNNDNVVSYKKDTQSVYEIKTENVYLENNGNNIIEMDKYSSIYSLKISYIDQCINHLEKMTNAERLEIGKDYEYMTFLLSLRNKGYYEMILKVIMSGENNDLKKAITLFLATINYENIFAEEETFIISMLREDDLEGQEFALNTLLLWDSTNYLAELKSIKIKNIYLQKDLEEFIAEKER